MSTSVSSLSGNYFPSPQNGFTTTLASSISAGATTVPLNSVAGFTNGQVAVLVVDPNNSSKQTFTGVVDTVGVQLTSVVWTAGTNVAHLSGATVVDYATATHIAMISKGLLVAHNLDGTHKSGLSLPSPVLSGTATGTYTLGGTPTITSPTITGAVITYANLLSTIFSGQTTSFANAGSAGGTFKYINLGGIKLLWGTTATVTLSGSGAQTSGGVAVTLPVGFFTTIEMAVPAPGAAAAGTTNLSASIQALSTSSISVSLSQAGGTNGASGVALFVIGT